MAEDDSSPFAEAARQFTDGQNQFLKMWTDFAGKMATAGVSLSPDSTPPDTAKQMRAAFFKAWSEHCNDYMRSPEFLESWKKAMDGAIEWRRQMNQTLGRMHHEFQGTSRQDIDHLMQALTHLERRLVDNHERAADRLQEMAARIKALEAQLAEVEGKAAKPKAKRPVKKTASKTNAAKKKAAKKKAARKKSPGGRKS